MNNKYSIYIDEAGRGPLAGPVCVGIVMPISFFDNKIFDDSKKLSLKKRDFLFSQIQDLENNGLLLYSYGYSSNKEIDEFGISKAINIAIKNAILMLVEKIIFRLEKFKGKEFTNGYEFINYFNLINEYNKFKRGKIDYKRLFAILSNIFTIKGIFIDGNNDFGISKDLSHKVITIIDGDAKNKYIGMASIVAKVNRDKLMIDFSKKINNYYFEKHKGYGTKLHIEMIKKYGPSELHRISFLKNILDFGNLNLDKYNSTIIDKTKLNLYKTHKIGKPKLLIHICCAPDLTYPLKFLKKYFKIYLFWYNPNIQNSLEHGNRKDQVSVVVENIKGKYEIVDYNNYEEFNKLLLDNKYILQKTDNLDKVKFLNYIGKEKEGGDRCDICYFLRLDKSYQIATQLGIDYFTTTLSISPKKDLCKIQNYGGVVSNKGGAKFLFFDFRKNGGYLESLKLTKKYGIYRQNYCGCNYSKFK